MKRRYRKVKSETFTSLEVMRKFRLENKWKLIKLWNGYNDHDEGLNYNDIYKVRIAKDHMEKMIELFLPIDKNGKEKKSSCLDVGCGPGTLFRSIYSKIGPEFFYAVDWSPKMLEDARQEIKRLQQEDKANFEFSSFGFDISDGLPWDDNTFDCSISNMVICYLACGWKKPVEELMRVTKVGGYIYIGTLLENWSFRGVLWKHFLPEFIREPVTSLQGLKYRRIISKISKELKKEGAQFPSREELIGFIKELGLKEMKVISTYWGGGLVLRVKKK